MFKREQLIPTLQEQDEQDGLQEMGRVMAAAKQIIDTPRRRMSKMVLKRKNQTLLLQEG